VVAPLRRHRPARTGRSGRPGPQAIDPSGESGAGNYRSDPPGGWKEPLEHPFDGPPRRHLAPPAQAIVLCCDEKSQCQALERTQLGLPLAPKRSRTMTHDYVRHGTVTLFAALE